MANKPKAEAKPKNKRVNCENCDGKGLSPQSFSDLCDVCKGSGKVTVKAK